MNGKQPTLAPRGVETLHSISMKFGKGDYVNKLNKPAKFEFDRTKKWRRHRNVKYTLGVTYFSAFIFYFLLFINCKN